MSIAKKKIYARQLEFVYAPHTRETDHSDTNVYVLRRTQEDHVFCVCACLILITDS